MRQAGAIPHESEAQRFASFLIAEGIDAQAEADQGAWTIWVRDENHLESAKAELAQFLADPADPRYQNAERAAAAKRREQAQQRDKTRGKVVQMRGRWGRGTTATARGAPLVMVLILLSVFVGIFSGLGAEPDSTNVRNQLSFSRLTPATPGQPFGGWDQIKQGQLWRLITPIFIHFGVPHLVFNMFALYSFGAQIEDRRGTWRLGVMVLTIAVVSNTLQFLWSGPGFGGMSGVCYGLFGVVWMRMIVDPNSRLFVSSLNVFIMVAWFLLCIAQDLPVFQDSVGDVVHKSGVANIAHAAGLFMGLAIGYAPVLFRARN